MKLDRTKTYHFVISDEQQQELWQRAKAEQRDVFELMREFAGYDACQLDNDDLMWVMAQERLQNPDADRPIDFQALAEWERAIKAKGISLQERLHLAKKYLMTGVWDEKLKVPKR